MSDGWHALLLWEECGVVGSTPVIRPFENFGRAAAELMFQKARFAM